MNYRILTLQNNNSLNVTPLSQQSNQSRSVINSVYSVSVVKLKKNTKKKPLKATFLSLKPLQAFIR